MLKLQIKVCSRFFILYFSYPLCHSFTCVVTSLDQLDGRPYITPPCSPLRLSFPIFLNLDARHLYERAEI
jgi:hypothetical protein